MSHKPKCERCGQTAESHNNQAETTFWGWIIHETETVTTRFLRFKAQFFQRAVTARSPLLLVDEKKPLCDDCWGDLVGLFMQGRAVPALSDRALSQGVPGARD